MHIRLSVFGPLLAIGLLAASAIAAPAQADALEPSAPAVRGALKAYGWKSEAVDYLLAHVRFIASSGGVRSVCPAAVACTTPAGVMYLNLVTDDQATFSYVINHEMIHAMQLARGSREGVVGGQLADLLAMSTDSGYPLAAAAASRILGLTGSQDYAVLDQQDWFHMDHDVLQDVGWDVGNLPPWFRVAYFPYLNGAPSAVSRPRQAVPGGAPADLPRRRQRVVDTLLTMCGPSMPGAHMLGDMPPCGAGTPWSAAPYPPFGAGGRAPAATPPAPAPLSQGVPSLADAGQAPPSEDAPALANEAAPAPQLLDVPAGANAAPVPHSQEASCLANAPAADTLPPSQSCVTDDSGAELAVSPAPATTD